MSKVLEETWEARLWYHHANDAQRPVSEIYLPDAPSTKYAAAHERCISAFEPETWDSDSASAERCQLAACAPEMARMLLEHHAELVKATGRDTYCLGCGGFLGTGHDPDCPLVALLRKAGVIE